MTLERLPLAEFNQILSEHVVATEVIARLLAEPHILLPVLLGFVIPWRALVQAPQYRAANHLGQHRCSRRMHCVVGKCSACVFQPGKRVNGWTIRLASLHKGDVSGQGHAVERIALERWRHFRLTKKALHGLEDGRRRRLVAQRISDQQAQLRKPVIELARGCRMNDLITQFGF